MPSVCYVVGVAFDYDGNEIGRWNGGEYQEHFANFLKAVRSRDHRDLHLDIENGTSLRAGAKPGQSSLRTGTAIPRPTRPSELADNKHVAQTLDSFESYLKENAVDYAQTKFYLGKADD